VSAERSPVLKGRLGLIRAFDRRRAVNNSRLRVRTSALAAPCENEHPKTDRGRRQFLATRATGLGYASSRWTASRFAGRASGIVISRRAALASRPGIPGRQRRQLNGRAPAITPAPRMALVWPGSRRLSATLIGLLTERQPGQPKTGTTAVRHGAPWP
jgi:hypothetical protein